MSFTPRGAERNSTSHEEGYWRERFGQQHEEPWAPYQIGSTAGSSQTTSSDYGQCEGSASSPDFALFEYRHGTLFYGEDEEDNAVFQTEALAADHSTLDAWQSLYVDATPDTPRNYLQATTDGLSGQSDFHVPRQPGFDYLHHERQFDEHTLRPNFDDVVSSTNQSESTSLSLYRRPSSPLDYALDCFDVHSYAGAPGPFAEHDNIWDVDEDVHYAATATASDTPGSSTSHYEPSTLGSPELAESSISSTTHTCTICSSHFQRPGDLRRHMLKHQGHTYTCEVPGCAGAFYRLDKLRDHVRQAHKGTVTSSSQGLEFDVPEDASASTSSTYPCADCQEVYSTPGALKRHVNRKHNRRFACSKCDAAFHLNADLRRHEAAVHEKGSVKTYPCPNVGCDYKFSRRDNLSRHTRKCKHGPSVTY